jgi:hypothetical protein
MLMEAQYQYAKFGLRRPDSEQFFTWSALNLLLRFEYRNMTIYERGRSGSKMSTYDPIC